MKRTLCALLAGILMFGACALADARVEGVDKTMEEFSSLAELSMQYGFKMGAAFSYNQINDARYKALVTKHFGSLTPTNELKAYSMLDQGLSKRSTDGMPFINFGKADAMMRFAQENGLSVRGHVLVWDAYMADWFFREGYQNNKPLVGRDVMLKRLEYYITTVVTHFEEKFPGVIYCWDVVNEAVGDSGADSLAGDARHLRTKRSGTDNLFYTCIGEDYVELSFQYARAACQAAGADIKLFYNDYNAFAADKGKAMRALIDSINSYVKDENGANVKLCDGVGMQGYIGGYGTQAGCMNNGDITRLRDAIRAYADMGLEVQITEMAVRNYQNDAKSIARHAEFYGQIMKLLRATNINDERKPFTCLTIWGLFDAPSLPKDNYSYRLNGPYCGLFTEDYQVKTAFVTVHDILSGK